MQKNRWLRRLIFTAVILYLAITAISVEIRSSRLQAGIFHRWSRHFSWEIGPGPSPNPVYPLLGPYPKRHGYASLGEAIESLTARGFKVAEQSRLSAAMSWAMRHGIAPIYDTKPQAGLIVLDRKGEEIYSALRPAQIYNNFHQIPQIIADCLLFIENRELLDAEAPFKNPAVEWNRFTRAAIENIAEKFIPGIDAPGGSTIATQIEKYRFSAAGRTSSHLDKLNQMISASLRAYHKSQFTLETRQKILLDYVNSIPLAALPGYGEVNGLAEGLSAWYGVDFEKFSQSMREIAAGGVNAQAAEHFTQALSLFIAHRRPTYFLLAAKPGRLKELTDQYLRVLTSASIISTDLRDAALQIKLSPRRKMPAESAPSFVQRKASSAVRNRLLQVLSVKQLYDLDQIDLIVDTSINRAAHDAITEVLLGLASAKETKSRGLQAHRILARGDPSKVIYSFTLYERSGCANWLRVQTDNMDRPFDLNEGARLDLGSTAKLRTLVTYLEVVERLFKEVTAIPAEELRKLHTSSYDSLTSWAIGFYIDNPGADMQQMLSAAMQRKYSASPAEKFFTGGGLHTFRNFKPEDNGREVTVSEAFRHSINLPFIRIMRDISKYFGARLTGSAGKLNALSKADLDESSRQEYLRQFAAAEGAEFLAQFYKKYQGDIGKEVLQRFLRAFRLTPKKLAIIYRSVYPKNSSQQMAHFFEERQIRLPVNTIEGMYRAYDPAVLSLNDRAFLIKKHPLELWLVAFLTSRPTGKYTWQDVMDASYEQRIEAYRWLFEPSKKRAQDLRIRSMLERDAFKEIHRSWAATGYPFKSIVPSYASAIGSAGDRPAALSELVGIIMNDGMRYPEVRLQRLRFAKDTPFETTIVRDAGNAGKRVLSPEVAAVARTAMIDVVQNGTARRLRETFADSDGKVVAVGAKTGTGDHQYKTFGKGGILLNSQVISRTATLVFFIGTRFYGTVSAHVRGPEAAQYDFTSALAAELLKVLSPVIQPLLIESREGEDSTSECQ